MRKVIAGPSNPIHIESIHPDVKRERLRHYPVQLSNAGTVTTIEIPGWAKILKIYPLEYDVVYAFDENPSAATFNADTSLVYTDSLVGDVAVGRQWESRILHEESRFIHLVSLTTGVQLYVTFSSGD